MVATTTARRRRRTGWIRRTLALVAVGVAVAAGSPPASAGLDDDPGPAEPVAVDPGAIHPDAVEAEIILAKEIRLWTVGPRGAVTVVGDSVLLGAGIYSPTLPDRLVEHGWGPINFRAAVGHKAGKSSSGHDSNYAEWWIRHWRTTEGWDAPNVIVNLGANDSGICRTDVACAKRRIEILVDIIGPGHQVWWPKITQTPSQHAWAVAWNAALDQVAAERADFFTWDWPAEMGGGGYPSNDNIHLSPDGYRKRSMRMAEEFTAALSVRDFRVGSVGVLGAVSVVGDSVLLGSGRGSPTLPDRLVQAGWGPVHFRAATTLTAGPPSGQDAAGWWLALWRDQGWNAPNVIVNLGVNDVAVCGTDAACARARIVAVLDTIGAGHRVWWPKITHPDTAGAAAFNQALDDIAAERAEVFTWDWPTEMFFGGYVSPDGVHLTPPGYQQRSIKIAAAFTHDLTRSVRVGPDEPLPAPIADPSRYLPAIPARIVDTRPNTQPAGSVLTVDFGNRLPADATAVAVSVTAVDAAADGYLAAGPCGTPIGASTVNYTTGVNRAAMTVTPLGTGDDICVYTSATTDIIVDLQGAFIPATPTTGDGLVPLAVPRRLTDTTVDAFTPIRVDLATIAPDATAAAINLTVDAATGAGFLTAVPCTNQSPTPTVSNLNYQPGEAVASAAYTTIDTDHTICVTTSTPARVIVDLTATFTTDGGLQFSPVTPTRLLDTRNRIGGWTPIHGNDQTLDIQATPPDAHAVTGTITQVTPLTNGYQTAHPCPNRPATSTVNANAGLTLANSLTTSTAPGGRLCIYSQPTTHTLLDITGYWTTPAGDP